MDSRLLYALLICTLCIRGHSCILHTGQEFITAFLQNSNSPQEDAKLELILTAITEVTTANIIVVNKNFSWPLQLNIGEPQSLKLPKELEMVGSGFFDMSILIIADQDISVTMVSSKTNSTDRTLVLPVDQLDNEYYIVTPGEERDEVIKEFAVVNYDLPSIVQIYMKGWVMFQGSNITSGNPLHISLAPFQAVQLQSVVDLSGTRVVSTNPVAVFSGVTCTWRNARCGHVYEQLYPVSKWGRQYIVVPIPYQSRYDTLYVTASQYTQVNYTRLWKDHSVVMNNGDILSFQIWHNAPVQISANVSIQVLYYCTGGVTENIYFDPFFLELPDISKFCTKYQVQGLQGITNAILMTAKTAGVSAIRFNRLNLRYILWKQIPGTEYSWAFYRYGRQGKTHTVSHSLSTISVLNVGISPKDSFGLSGVCFMSENPCANKQCRKRESCLIIKGKPACIPDSEAICQIWGDPHFQTFDGLQFDFQGTCTYTVAKTCMDLRAGGDATLPEFTIEAKFNNQRSRQSSYIDVVSIRIDDFNITMVQSEFGMARVNNVRWTLPIFLDDGRIRIINTGFHALLETSFIRIRYDWNVFLLVKIPSSFFENICGLCGNYNGLRDDDFEAFNGVQVSDLKEFAKSWKVRDECASCWDDCHGPCQPISPTAGRLYSGLESCGIMSYIYGPFYRCHSVVNPKVYVDACVNDMVRNNGYRKVLCEAILVYLVACHIYGVRVEDWRTHVGCEMKCPYNSVYNPCGNPCPESCAGSLPSCQEQLQCMETCECKPGFVLHRGSCIAKHECGSFCNGRHYPLGKKFWADGKCSRQCWCESQTLKCSSSACLTGEECAVRNGIQDCYPKSYSSCTTIGSHHYVTFDRLHYDFHGTCSYQLSGLCDKTRGLTDFTIETSNSDSKVQPLYFSKLVLVKVYGVEIMLSKENKARAKINGTFFNLPINLYEDHVQIFTKGWDGVILTTFGLKLTFDWDSRVTVTLPSSYSSAVCGLCGNFNGNAEDDITSKSRVMASSILAFVKSWRTSVDNLEWCGERETSPCPLLKDMETDQRRSAAECGVLLKDDGPFRECRKLLNPEEYFQTCLYDFCFYAARQDLYCKVIEAYAAACQDLKGTVFGWRDDGFCKTWCPQNSYYTLYSDDTLKTCSGRRSPSGCSDSGREGCICEDGYLLDGGHCVLPPHCDCVLSGVYYKVGEEFFPSQDCGRRCTCEAGGRVDCRPFSCSPFEVCKTEGGVRRCHATKEATCSVTSGSFYRTFDGVSFSFSPNCTYALTKTCQQGLHSAWNFSVYISVTESMRIMAFVNGVKIMIRQGRSGQIQVDDVFVNLPVDLKEKGVLVYQHGVGVVLNTRLGLDLIYDLASQLIIRFSGSFRTQICGLCGNYNGDATDDLQLPDKRPGSDVNSLAAAWEEPSLGFPCEAQCLRRFCPPCDYRGIYEGKSRCGLLLIKDGPFGACHHLVDPVGFFNNCVNVLCLEDGSKRVFCASIQSYVTVCQSLGVTRIKWRDGLCDLQCPQNSHYESCADTCTSTCAAAVAPSACSRVCIEGCQCNEGFYLDRDKCVPLGGCGCNIEGRYYSQNESFLMKNCTEECTCGIGGSVRCTPYLCPATCVKSLDRTFRCDQTNGEQ